MQRTINTTVRTAVAAGFILQASLAGATDWHKTETVPPTQNCLDQARDWANQQCVSFQNEANSKQSQCDAYAYCILKKGNGPIMRYETEDDTGFCARPAEVCSSDGCQYDIWQECADQNLSSVSPDDCNNIKAIVQGLQTQFQNCSNDKYNARVADKCPTTECCWFNVEGCCQDTMCYGVEDDELELETCMAGCAEEADNESGMSCSADSWCKHPLCADSPK